MIEKYSPDNPIVLSQPKHKREALIKPQSSGLIERVVVVGGGLWAVYSFAATIPLVSVAAVGMLACHFWKEISNFQTPAKAAELEEILNSRTPAHPSILDSEKELKQKYPIAAVNRAIERMIGNCCWIQFKRKDDHYLAPYGEVYCYQDPDTGEVMLPIHALLKTLQEWGIEPTVTVESTAVKEEPLAIVPTQTSIAELTPVVDSHQASPTDLLDVPKLIVDEMYSYAIIAPSGGGKGMLISNTTRLVKQRLPHITVMLMDAKNDPRESGYWDGVVDIWHKADFGELEPEDKSAWVNEGLDLYRSITGAKLLIFDEATMVMGFCKLCDKNLLARVQDLITTTASSGNSFERYVWLVGHSGNLADYGVTGGQMASFKNICVFPSNNLKALSQLGNTKFTGNNFDERKRDEIVAIAEQSPVNRAVYIGTKDQWFPMAQLPNHSGYDRDSRTFLNPTQDTVAENSESGTVVHESTPVELVDLELELFIRTLARSLGKAQADGRDINAITPEKLLNLPAAKDLNLDLNQAEISLERAKQLL